MGDAYGRRVYHGPPRQEWVNTPPQYYASGVIDPFGITGGGYVAPGMVRPGNMGPPMIPGAFQHQAPFALPPPGPSPNSNLPFRSSNIGARGTIISQPAQVNHYGNHQGSALISQMQGPNDSGAPDIEVAAVSPQTSGLIHLPHSSGQIHSSSAKYEKKKPDNKSKPNKKSLRGTDMNFTRFKVESKLDGESLAYITEDTRMSTLQRKLVREPNPVIAFGLALQISEVILYHENRGYVYRSSEVICDAIKEVFLGSKSSGGSSNVSHGDVVKSESAKAMGRVAYVLSEGMNSDEGGGKRNANKESPFDQLYTWIWKQYKQSRKESPRSSVYFLKSFETLIALKPIVLSDLDVNRICGELQEELENTESSFAMMALVDIFVVVSNSRPTTFKSRFQDVVDILVGWHIDSSQKLGVRNYTSDVLLHWHAFWINDMESSTNLLKQFIEDLTEELDTLKKEKKRHTDKLHYLNEIKTRITHILPIMQVFNTVLSCVRSLPPDPKIILVKQSIEWLDTILECLLLVTGIQIPEWKNEALHRSNDGGQFNEDIIVTGQQTIMMLLEMSPVPSPTEPMTDARSLYQKKNNELFQLLEFFLYQFSHYSRQGQMCVLNYTLHMLNLAAELGIQGQKYEEKIVQLLSHSRIAEKAAFSVSKQTYKVTANLFRQLLKSKNIIILQEVYCHLTEIYESALVTIANIKPFLKKGTSNQNAILENETTNASTVEGHAKSYQQTRYTKKEGEILIFFVLECLSDLVNAKGSVLSMWALDPSIFNLLVKNSGLLEDQQDFRWRSPWIHEALVKTLIIHCTCHNQFTSSSNLITNINMISHSSPTVKYLETILETAASFLSRCTKPNFSHNSLHLAVVDWATNIFEEAKKFEQHVHGQQTQGSSHGVVLSNKKFRDLFLAMIHFSCKDKLNREIVESCLNLVKSILIDFPLIGPHTQEVSKAVRECALLHLKSTSAVIQEMACQIFGLIPPMIGHWISDYDLKNHVQTGQRTQLTTTTDLHDLKMMFLRSSHEPIKPTDFKVLVDNLLKSPSSNPTSVAGQIESWKHLEIHSCQEINLEKVDEKQLVEWITTNLDIQSFWIGYQLAQFCVNSKLKTPLGKAQETLTTIEKVIRRLTTNAAAASVVKTSQSPEDGQNTKNNEEDSAPFVLNVFECRRLLTFFELLEKSMANAWDGSAYYWAGPSGGKPITAFFTANKRTCHDWLSRLRVTVVQLAFYIGEYAFVVRNAFVALENFISTKLLTINTSGDATNSTNTPISLNPTEELQFVHLIVLTALALCKLRGSQHLHGLYVWCKENTGKKFRWISPLIDFVKHRVENGIQGFQASLMHPAVLESASYGDAMAGGAITYLAKEAYLFHAFLHQPMSPTYQMAAYEAQAEKYKQKIVQSCSEPHTQKYLEALSSFDNGVVLPTYKDDESLYSESLGIPSLFRADDILIHSHQLLLQAASCFQSGYGKLPSWKDSGKLPNSLQKAGVQLNSLLKDHRLLDDQFQRVLILKGVHNELNALVEKTPGKLGRFLSLVDVRNHKQKLAPTSQLILIKKWGEFFTKYRKNNPKYYFQLNSLNLEIAVVARKEKNYKTAGSYLRKMLVGLNMDLSLKDYMQQLDLSSSLLSVERASSLRQAAKLIHVLGDGDAGVLSVQTLCGIATSIYNTYSFQYQQGQGMESSMTELLEISSRALNTMAKWFRLEPMLLEKVYPDMISSISDRSTVAHVLQLEQSLPAPSIQDFLPMPDTTISEGQGSSVTDTDMVIGRLIRLAVIQAPQIAKIWNTLANWSLELGERNLATCGGNIVELNVDEKESIFSVLSTFNQSSGNYEKTLSYENQQIQYNEIISLISHIKLKHSGVEVGEAGKNELMKKTMSEDCKFLHNAPSILLDNLQLIWEKVQKRVFFYHETAVNAYFQFLSRTESQQSEKIVTATLRLLQLTVRHPLELQECLQTGLASTPSSKWRAIIPQLFSRLNHPVLIVRNRISELICRIANDYPQLIIYPAVVGSVSKKDTEKFSNLLATVVHDPDDDNYTKNGTEKEVGSYQYDAEAKSSEERDGIYPEMQSAYAKIVDFIIKQRSGVGQKSVEQVQTVVYELQRISLLWDELWVGTLQQYGNEVNRRVKKMEDEVQRLDRNHTLSEHEKTRLVKEKYNIIFKPLIYILEKVAAVTCKGESEPETPHEKSFASKYGDFLANAIPKLKEPSNPGKPKDVWGILHQLQLNLTNRINKKNLLKMSEISTKLSSMKCTFVPLPGNDCDSDKDLVIDSFDDILTILPTKTKPKRLSVRASDGRKYTYLFKGLEDLHLDERIMQFLKIANIMMLKRGKGDYSARHYSVVPLGPRSGLIQWVEGAIPLYSLYKRWQQRQQSNDAAAKKTSETTSTPTAYQKPSEAFYGKMVPLLRDHGITNLDNRKEWPQAIMKQVHQNLVAETPKNLLSQEIWFASVDSESWFKMTERITRSFAVMSVIGYIIGLGDRHLDNLLVDLNSGEVIHIDYNCCFEKGKNLRIPERVPCRLTQNVVNVFGITGVDGVFRLSCEHVLDAMRSGRETLLTLLEAFVYDPLVDWTPGIELGFAGAYQGGARQNLLVGQDMAQDKRDMQTEITFSMLSVRVSEIRGPWLENQGNLIQALAGVEDGLNLWLDVTHNIQQLNDYLTKLHHGMSILKEAEANPGHRLYSLQDRYVEHKMVEQAVMVAQEKAAKFIEECEKCIHLHQRALDSALTPAQLGKWTTDVADTKVVNSGGESGIASSKTSTIVKTFLENAGQIALLEQLQGVENVFGKGLEKLKSNLQTCLLLLASYSTVTSLFPQSYKSEHRNTMYVKWINQISENNSAESCHNVLTAFTANYVDRGHEQARLKQHHILNLNYQMESWTQEINFRLQNIYERMIKEGINCDTGNSAILESISQSRTELQQYLQNETCNTVYSIMNGVAVTKLAEVTKKILVLESTVHLNGDACGFVDLSNSDWFLFDEILMQIGYSSQFLDTLDYVGVFSDMSTRDSLKCCHQLQNAVKQLQNLSSSFFAVILQEGLKCFLREDPSIISIAVELNNILTSSNVSLEETIEELNIQIRYLVSGIETSDNNASSIKVVSKKIKSQYQAMVKTLSDTGNRSSDVRNDNMTNNSFEQGKMIFMAFNSLFDAVDFAMAEVKQTFASVGIPESWSIGIDSMAESRIIVAQGLIREDVGELTELWTFLNRLFVLKEYFSMCMRSSACFKTGCNSVVGTLFPSGDELARPLKVYVTEYFRRSMLGIASLCLSVVTCNFVNLSEPTLLMNLPDANSGPTKLSILELAKAYADRKLTLPGKDRAHFLSLELENLCGNILKSEVAKFLEQNVEALNASQRISQLQRASFQWFHETHLPLDAITLSPPVRSPLIIDLRNYMSMVLLLLENLTAQQKKYQEYHSTVEQRMRWACGANPDLQDVFDAYSTSFEAEIESLRRLITIGKSVCSTINTVLHHEALRTQTTESIASDSAFVALVTECQNAFALKHSQAQNQTLTEQELALFSMNPPKEASPNPLQPRINEGIVDFTIDRNWILGTEETIASRVKNVQADLIQENQRLSLALSSLHQAVTNDLKSAINIHQKLMADVGALLKAIDKSSEVGGETEYEVPEIKKYLVKYRVFSDLISSMIQELAHGEDLTEEKSRYLTRNIEHLKEVIGPIYEDLVEFATLLREDNIEIYKKARKEVTENGFLTNGSGIGGVGTKKQGNNEQDGIGINLKEEKNTFALNVLRRVRAKLEGREPDVLRRSSVAEQVDFIIREATNLDNLALLYEGWTSWI